MTRFSQLIDKAASGPLTADSAVEAFAMIMEGSCTPAQVAGLLMAMRTRGESIDEIHAAASVMRRMCNPVIAPPEAIDIVGTGGDGKGTLNISTAAAFVVAGAGVPVAKHGNRNLSSKSGAADILTEMGINVMVGADVAQRAMDQTDICFMMAPMHHPAMRHVMPARTELGVRTIFNILGPLTNPAGVSYQLTGAFSDAMLKPMARTLRRLGCRNAWLVHGSDGTDEISICGPTSVVELRDGSISNFSIAPEDAGLGLRPMVEIIGGTPGENAHALRDLLDGVESAYRDAVLLNAAAALHISGRADSLTEGVEIAADSIDTGKAWSKVRELVRVTGD